MSGDKSSKASEAAASRTVMLLWNDQYVNRTRQMSNYGSNAGFEVTFSSILEKVDPEAVHFQMRPMDKEKVAFLSLTKNRPEAALCLIRHHKSKNYEVIFLSVPIIEEDDTRDISTRMEDAIKSLTDHDVIWKFSMLMLEPYMGEQQMAFQVVDRAYYPNDTIFFFAHGTAALFKRPRNYIPRDSIFSILPAVK
ncbi:uncharacterized protein TRIADDRAFT_61700 [Trichoplax adhaerens]|uniref:Uncharacterized protein n=1 Tax=Trichoplax adhaerens TaxID=10228 RepID=B3SBQ6_TRIAD|nr:predicted protein [Trichoplax adhaerens]EDV19832.1 predicted protein [Trichoplax adhaerens]|eukprot:XP_002117702.1 predicted protein [Trichoplax adhaerens]